MNTQKSRTEEFLYSIIKGNSEKLPIPQSRVEEFLSAIISGNISKLPDPQSRIEEYLNQIARNGLGGNSLDNQSMILDTFDIELRPIFQAFGMDILYETNISQLSDNAIIEVVDAT